VVEYEDIVDARRRYSALLEKSLESLIETLRRRPDILRISIFGSYARGRTDLFTDLDVLVIMDSARPFIERQSELYELLGLPVDLDLLCYTPDEFDKIKHRPFFRHALTSERVLYEKKSA